MNELLVGNPGCGYTVHWGLCSHHSHTSSHFVWNRRSFCEVIALPLRQGKHFTFTQQPGHVLSAEYLAGCKAMSHFSLPPSPTYILVPTFSLSLSLTHIPKHLHLICFLQLYSCVQNYCKTCYESKNVLCVFDTGNFCHFHLWSRICLKNLGCWVLLSLQRMEGETQICQEAFVHAG